MFENKNLGDFLKEKKIDELKKYTNVAFKSGNLILLKEILKTNEKIIKEEFLKKNDYLFSICKHSDYSVYTYYRNLIKNNEEKDQNGNNCLHYAAKYGNFQLIRKLIQDKIYNPNSVNFNSETPLHYLIKYGDKNYMKTAILLAEVTDLTIKDKDKKEVYRLDIKNLKENFRLSEILLDLMKEQTHKKL